VRSVKTPETLASDTSSLARAPRLLWAVSHPTLVRAEVPVLRAAGINVVPEEPDPSVLRELDFVEYPDILGESANHHELHVGRNLQLWARGGRVSKAEATAVNAAFDAIMVASRLDVAIGVRRWFEGEVLFRWFGHVPSLHPSGRTGAVSGIRMVPIFRSLLRDDFSRRFASSSLLRTVIPRPPSEGGEEGREGSVGVYLGGLSELHAWREYLARIAHGARGRSVVVFGLSGEAVATLSPLPSNVTILPRLARDDYWRMFASLSVMVYPHSDPKHSHYVPFEAIQMRIPCLMLRGGAVAGEAIGDGQRCDESMGVLAAPGDISDSVSRLLSSRRATTELVSAQQALLVPFSQEVVTEQAGHLREIITPQTLHRDGQPEVEPGLGIPSTSALRRAHSGGPLQAAHVAASSIVAVSNLNGALSAEFGYSPRNRTLSEVVLHPGDDVLLKCGAPVAGVPLGQRLRVRVRTRGNPQLVAVAEVALGDNIVSASALSQAVESGDGDCWGADLRIPRGHSARIRLLTSLMPSGVRLRDVDLRQVAEGQDGGAMGGEPWYPLWPLARGRVWRLGRLMVRMLIFTLQPGERIRTGGGVGGCVLVAGRGVESGRLRMRLIRAGRRTVGRSMSRDESFRGMAIGSARALRSLTRSQDGKLTGMSSG
jgi:hypothetical protein